MRRFGLLGRHISYSFSPELHQAFFRTQELEATYELIDLFDAPLTQAVYNQIKSAYDGINVTIPFKTEIMPFLDQISDDARAIGAVNTIRFDHDLAYGYNTDAVGFTKTCQSLDLSAIKEAYVLGSGGAAKVCHYVLNRLGIPSIGVSRSGKGITYEALALSDPNSALLVNATPVGSKQMEGKRPIEKSLTKKFTAVVDLIYTPFETQLLNDAVSFGIPVVNGITMLMIQAYEAERIWWPNESFDASFFMAYGNRFK